MATRTRGIQLGRFGKTVARGSGLKGYIQWRVPPEVLEQAVLERGEALIKNVDRVMTQGAQLVQKRARELASETYTIQTPRAAPGLTASRESPGGFAGARGSADTFRIFLFHGPRTKSPGGYYYGRVLEASRNQYGRFKKDTEVIMPTINQMGPIIIGKMQNKLIE